MKYPGYYGYDLEDVNYNENIKNENNKFPLDTSLVKDLLSIVSPSSNEEPMIEFILDFISKNIPEARVDVDNYGNIYVVKNTTPDLLYYPCVVSHTDEVVSYYPNRVIVELSNAFIGINDNTGLHAGTGGDDKCGIYICLEMLRILPDVKVVFFTEEEIGGFGSRNCNVSFFKDCRYVIQPDRYGNNSFITETNGVRIATDEFLKDCSSIMTKYNYIEDPYGSFTDVGVLARDCRIGLAMVNISCGYYDQHTEEEVVCKSDLENAMNFTYFIISTLPDYKYKRILEISPIRKIKSKTSILVDNVKVEDYHTDNISDEQYGFDIDYLSICSKEDLLEMESFDFYYFMRNYPEIVKDKIGEVEYNKLIV